MNIHVHVSYYNDKGEANDVESGLGYWSSQTNKQTQPTSLIHTANVKNVHLKK